MLECMQKAKNIGAADQAKYSLAMSFYKDVYANFLMGVTKYKTNKTVDSFLADYKQIAVEEMEIEPQLDLDEVMK